MEKKLSMFVQLTVLCFTPAPQVTLQPDQAPADQVGQGSRRQGTSDSGLEPGQEEAGRRILWPASSETQETSRLLRPRQPAAQWLHSETSHLNMKNKDKHER